MHENNMDKKKKNEEDKEVIDFMKLVEENLSNIGNDKICETEDGLFENKPLQPSSDLEGISNNEEMEVITEDVLNDLRAAVEENLAKNTSTSEDINFELESLNSKIEQMAMESPSLKKSEEALNPGLKAETDLKFETAQKPRRASSTRQSGDRSLILRKDEVLDLHEEIKDLKIKKYPGFLYIDIYSIEKYISSDTDVQSVFIKMETKDFVYETDDYSEDSNIKLNSLVPLNIKNSDPFSLKFILNKRTSSGVVKSSECIVKIDKDFLDKVHNTLFEINYEWAPYSSSNFIKSFISFFTSEVADAWGLKLFFSFVSEEEFGLIGVTPPSTLYDLGKWLKIRKYAYNTWFTGFCNIRGYNTNICTHLWKRRFIKVHGYKVLIYNEHTKNLLGIFDLLSTMSKERDIFEEDNKFRIINNEKMIEFHLESSEKYLQFKKVMEALL